MKDFEPNDGNREATPKHDKQISNLRTIIGVYKTTLSQCNLLFNHINSRNAVDLLRMRNEEVKVAVKSTMERHDAVQESLKYITQIYQKATYENNQFPVISIEDLHNPDLSSHLKNILSDLPNQDTTDQDNHSIDSKKITPDGRELCEGSMWLNELSNTDKLRQELVMIQERYNQSREREDLLSKRLAAFQDLEDMGSDMENKNTKYLAEIAKLKVEINKIKNEKMDDAVQKCKADCITRTDHNEIVRILSQKNHRLESQLERYKAQNVEMKEEMDNREEDYLITMGAEELTYARSVVSKFIDSYKSGDSRRCEQILPAVVMSLNLKEDKQPD